MPDFRRKFVRHVHDVQVAALGHDARAADQRHEEHEEDGKLLREGEKRNWSGSAPRRWRR